MVTATIDGQQSDAFLVAPAPIDPAGSWVAPNARLYWSAAGFVVLGVRTWMFETKIWPRMQPFMDTIMKRRAGDRVRALAK